jgi:D-3-phosphoglycerate dehydrogenase
VLVIRHRDRPGVLAHVFEHLRQADINAQETENIVFEGAEAAIARINVDRAPTQAQLDAIGPGNEHILSVQLVAL